MECSKLRRRFQLQKSDRSNINGTFEMIERFIMPYSGKFYYQQKSEGEINWRKRDLFDSTAVLANQNLAANIHSGLTNPVLRWFDIRFRDDALNSNQEALTWTEECSNRVFLALQESNFNLEVNEVYLDLTGFGTSIMVEEVEENSQGEFQNLDFMAANLSECYFEQDHNGNVVYFYRELSWTPVQVCEKFKKEDGTYQGVPDDIIKQAQEGTPDLRHDVIFAIFPRPGKQGDINAKIVAPKERPFGFKYFLLADGSELGEEGGYYEMPAFVPRWRKTTGSKWGHSPAMLCLSDVLTLNSLVALVLGAAEKVVDPPIMTTRRGVFGDVNIDAGQVTVVASMDSMRPYESGARFDVSALTKADLQQSIRQTFFMDQLQLKESPAMTATEVQVRYELMQRLMGPTLSRLQFDFLDPLVQRTFKILYRAGKLPEAPDVVKQAGAEFDIEYTGPMARAQKADQVSAIERWLMQIGQLSAVYPELRDLPDVDAAGRELGNLGGVPPKVIKPQARVNTERKKKEKAMKDQQQLDKVQQAAGAAKDLAAAGVTGGDMQNAQQAA